MAENFVSKNTKALTVHVKTLCLWINNLKLQSNPNYPIEFT